MALQSPASVTFTFHYVSIKSKMTISDFTVPEYLHSTMYLLNQTYEEAENKLNEIYIPLCIY